MLFVRMDCDPDREAKEKIRQEIRERTGEDCMLLGPHFISVSSIPVKKDEAAPGNRATSEDQNEKLPSSKL